MAAVLFDLDGTLLNTSPGIKESLLYTLSELHLAPMSDNEISRFIGPPIQNSLKDDLHLDVITAQKGAAIFRKHYSEQSLFKAAVYDNIYELLDTLHGRNIAVGIATYKREDYALRLIHHFGLDKYCSVIHGADFDGKLSKADIINQCISEIGTTSSEVIMVGDTLHDANAAQQALVKFVAVSWGFGFNDAEDKGYHNYPVIQHPLDLLQHIH